jgi:hypothetical protein
MSGELCKKGRKRVVEVSFFVVVEIEIEIGHGRASSLPQLHYMIDNCRASWQYKFLRGEADR